MKKYLTIIIAVILAISLIALCACSTPPNLPEGDFSKVLNRELPTLATDTNGDFSILQVTDLHLHGNGGKKDKKTLDGVAKLIENDEIDLVVITGDMVDGYNNDHKYNKETALKSIAELMEEKEQYWAYTLGNNDGEVYGSNSDIFAYLASYEHCLISDAGVGGVGNYTINISSGDEIVHTLIFVDSRMRGDDGKMLAIDKSQIDWYETVATEAKTNGVFTSIFMHVPFLEFAEAYQHGEIVYGYNNRTSTLDINVNPNSSLMYDAIVNAGNNGLIGTGHTHGSDYIRFYEDEYLLQVRAAGYSEWNDKIERGGAKIIIHTSATSKRELYTFSNKNFE